MNKFTYYCLLISHYRAELIVNQFTHYNLNTSIHLSCFVIHTLYFKVQLPKVFPKGFSKNVIIFTLHQFFKRQNLAKIGEKWRTHIVNVDNKYTRSRNIYFSVIHSAAMWIFFLTSFILITRYAIMLPTVSKRRCSRIQYLWGNKIQFISSLFFDNLASAKMQSWYKT